MQLLQEVRDTRDFLSWYLRQLCHHSVETCVIVGNKILCKKCMLQMSPSPLIMAMYEEQRLKHHFGPPLGCDVTKPPVPMPTQGGRF